MKPDVVVLFLIQTVSQVASDSLLLLKVQFKIAAMRFKYLYGAFIGLLVLSKVLHTDKLRD